MVRVERAGEGHLQERWIPQCGLQGPLLRDGLPQSLPDGVLLVGCPENVNGRELVGNGCPVGRDGPRVRVSPGGRGQLDPRWEARGPQLGLRGAVDVLGYGFGALQPRIRTLGQNQSALNCLEPRLPPGGAALGRGAGGGPWPFRLDPCALVRQLGDVGRDLPGPTTERHGRRRSLDRALDPDVGQPHHQLGPDLPEAQLGGVVVDHLLGLIPGADGVRPLELVLVASNNRGLLRVDAVRLVSVPRNRSQVQCRPSVQEHGSGIENVDVEPRRPQVLQEVLVGGLRRGCVGETDLHPCWAIGGGAVG
mmetsp:Transcript_46573/g.83303  ORF Transcript_46573/g.83303 Transcript_46573/m.83303 type:complete len:307 (-) Transcript_46573:739-1659(-)